MVGSIDEVSGNPLQGGVQAQAARYVLAVGTIALGWVLRLGLTALTGEGLPAYITFYPAVMVAALLAGFGPGVLATALAALLADYYLLPPDGFGVASPRDMAGLGLFCFMGVFMSAVAEFYRRARVKAEAYDLAQAVRDSETDLKRAQAVGQIGSWRLDVRRNILTWSEENHRIFGVPPGAPMSYETFLATVHPADREYVDRKWQAGLRGERYDIEHRLIVGGQVKWVRERAELEFSPEGELLGGFGTTQDITARKLAEGKLQDARALLQAATDNAAVGLVLLDRNRRYTFVNPAYVEILGLPFKAEELVGKGPAEVLAGVYESQISARLDRAFAGERVSYVLTRPRAGAVQGETAHYVVVYDPKSDASGAVDGVIVTIFDITAHRHAEEQLRLQAAAMHSAANGIVIVGRDGVIQWVNDAFTRLTGYSAAEVVGQSPRVLKSGRQPPEFYKNLWETVLAGRVWHGELVNRRKDGSLYDEEMTITPVTDGAEALTHFIAIKQDISERKRAGAELEVAHRRFAGIVESAMDAIITIDADQRIVLFNSAAEKMFRCTAADALGTPVDGLIPARSRPAHAKYVRAFGESGATKRMMGHLGELMGVRTDGEEFPIEASISKIEVGGERLYTVILRDITERRQAEETRLAAETARRVVEAQEAERRRLAEALHDTTSPNLAAIGLNLELCMHAATEQERAARLEDTRALLSDTASGIRDICFDLRPASLDYWGLLPAVESYADQLAKRLSIAIRVHATDFRNHLTSDQEAVLFRIVQEALTNCAKHAGASAIDVTFEGGEGGLRITIADNGVGFEPATLGSPGSKHGLGLLTMRERAEYAGGTFRIESQPGQGTRIVLEV